MKPLRIIGILILLVGIVMIGASMHIKNQVAKGREQISSGEKKVAQGKKLFGMNPVSKEIGNTALIDPAEKKIAAGKQQADEYAQLANRLQTGGIIAMFIGTGILVISFKKKR